MSFSNAAIFIPHDVKCLRADCLCNIRVKAKTLILAGTIDLLNPKFEAREVAKHIPDARYVSIDAKVPMGHVAGAGISAPENEVQNREIMRFLEAISGGRR